MNHPDIGSGPVVLYHANCTDGFTAAWCARKFFKGMATYIPAEYGDLPPRELLHPRDPLLTPKRHVYILDFSYPKHVLKGLAEHNIVTVLDHHKSARAAVVELLASGIIRGRFSEVESGAMLAWTWFFGLSTSAPPLVRHVQDRDLWRFALFGTREIHEVLNSGPRTFDRWDALHDEGIGKMIERGSHIVGRINALVAESVEATQRPMLIGGQLVMAANVPPALASEACDHMLHKGQDRMPFVACYWDTPWGRRFSLRSSDDRMDVSAVAEMFGGGGHRNAAGFKVRFDQLSADGDPVSGLQTRNPQPVAPASGLALVPADFDGTHNTTHPAQESST